MSDSVGAGDGVDRDPGLRSSASPSEGNSFLSRDRIALLVNLQYGVKAMRTA